MGTVFTLFETEYQRGNRGKKVLRMLTTGHLANNNPVRVVNICDENSKQQEMYREFANNCGVAYESQRRYEEAERAYQYSIGHHAARVSGSVLLARFYIRQRRFQDAEKHFIAAVDWSDDPADKALYKGEMIASVNPGSRRQATVARGYVEEALRLRPEWSKAELMLKKIDKMLNSSPNQEIDGED